MAIYKGREVQLLGRSNGEDVSPMYDVLDEWNQRSSVPFNQLQLTNEEMDQQKKLGVLHLDNASVIEDKDLQELRDSRDPKKIEENRKQQPTEPVEVKKIMVDPTEVTTPTVQPADTAKAKAQAKK